MKRMKFIIPVGNVSREKAERELAKLISEYKTDVNFDAVYGNLHINKHDDYILPIKDITIWDKIKSFFKA